MRKTVLFGSLLVGLTVGLVLLAQQSTSAAQVPSVGGVTAEVPGDEAAPGTLWQDTAAPLDKRCSFNSDCPYGTCKSNRCGGCSFNSDCKGWGVCKNGWCGGCSFNSDCKSFGSCKSGRCEKSPY